MFDAQGSASDAVVIKPDLAMWDEAHALGLECVVRVSESADLERALHYFDPEVFLLSVAEDAEDDPLTVLLELLHDVPAGKLAIADLHDATSEDVSELERSGVDAVLVSPDGLATLIQAGPPDV
jgi:indole-3-glycerol phosphate synthase